jgi:hypothetical protein
MFKEEFVEFEELDQLENEPTLPAVKLLKVQTVKLKAQHTSIQHIQVSAFYR